jgi:hypothetical protein
MGRHKGYKHSEETKRKIAMRTKEALSGGVAVAEQHNSGVSFEALPDGDIKKTEWPSGSVTNIPKPAEPPQPKDALDALALGPVKDIVALMLWKNRHNEPDMAVKLTEHDLRGFRACVEYLRVVPEVRIVRPQGLPGHGGIPVTRTRSAIPPQEPTPPKPYIVIALVEKGSENAIRPVENNEEDFAAAAEAREFRHARDIALQIAGQLQRDVATGNYSSSTIDEAVKCLVALAK